MISCLFKVSVVKCIEFLCRRRPRRRQRQRGQRRRGEQGAAPRQPHPIPSVPDITEGTEKRSCLPFAASSSSSSSLCPTSTDRPRPGCRQNHITYLLGRTEREEGAGTSHKLCGSDDEEEQIETPAFTKEGGRRRRRRDDM